jgi:dTDP-4-dehydrorhamnose 3,5-epimerase
VRFVAAGLEGAFVVELEEHADERGFFARAFSKDEFAEQGIPMDVVQANLSSNHEAGTVRGLHYQLPPKAEAKLFRCVKGAVYAVAVDLRPESPTYRSHAAHELSDGDHRALYVPPLCATGYQTLRPGSEVLYLTSAVYAPDLERGLRYDDPLLGIPWPLRARVVSAKDSAWPLLDPQGGDS